MSAFFLGGDAAVDLFGLDGVEAARGCTSSSHPSQRCGEPCATRIPCAYQKRVNWGATARVAGWVHDGDLPRAGVHVWARRCEP